MFIQSVFGLILFVLINNINSLSIRNEKCSKSCLNDAVCLIKNETIQCYCLPGWDGEHCDIPRKPPTDYQFLDKNKKILKTEFRVDPCTYVPTLCKNGGMCYFEEDATPAAKLSCQCPYPYAGDYCEEFSVCKDYCLHDRVCTVKADEPDCGDCDGLYGGKRCQSILTTTTLTPPPTTTNIVCTYLPGYCKNAGTCIVQNGKAGCQCPPGYTGETCDIPPGGTQRPGSSNNPGIINPGVTTPSGGSGGNGNACASNPCVNAPCYNNGNGYFCLTG